MFPLSMSPRQATTLPAPEAPKTGGTAASAQSLAAAVGARNNTAGSQEAFASATAIAAQAEQGETAELLSSAAAEGALAAVAVSAGLPYFVAADTAAANAAQAVHRETAELATAATEKPKAGMTAVTGSPSETAPGTAAAAAAAAKSAPSQKRPRAPDLAAGDSSATGESPVPKLAATPEPAPAAALLEGQASNFGIASAGETVSPRFGRLIGVSPGNESFYSTNEEVEGMEVDASASSAAESARSYASSAASSDGSGESAADTSEVPPAEFAAAAAMESGDGDSSATYSLGAAGAGMRADACTKPDGATEVGTIMDEGRGSKSATAALPAFFRVGSTNDTTVTAAAWAEATGMDWEHSQQSGGSFTAAPADSVTAGVSSAVALHSDTEAAAGADSSVSSVHVAVGGQAAVAAAGAQTPDGSKRRRVVPEASAAASVAAAAQDDGAASLDAPRPGEPQLVEAAGLHAKTSAHVNLQAADNAADGMGSEVKIAALGATLVENGALKRAADMAPAVVCQTAVLGAEDRAADAATPESEEPPKGRDSLLCSLLI